MNRSKTIDVIARAIAADEDTPFRNHADLYRLSARAILAALEASGMAVVPASALVDARANALKDAANAVDKELENGSPEHTWDNEEQVYDLARARAINAINDLPASPYGKAGKEEGK